MFGGQESYGGKVFGGGAVGAFVSGMFVYLNGVASGEVAHGTLRISEGLNQQGTAEFTLVNPAVIPVQGTQVLIVRDEERLFNGTIDRVSTTSNSPQTALWFQCECTDLSQIFERLVYKTTYTNVSVQDIVNDLFLNKLTAEGLSQGQIDVSASFPLVDSDNIRISELLRDVAGGAGVNYWVDAYRRLQMVAVSIDTSPFTLDVNSLQQVKCERSREQYRNVMVVKCETFDGNNSVTITRSDTVEITAHVAEGGSGRYEVYERIQHPTSNDTVDCQRLATSFAVILLSRSGAIQEIVSGTTNMRGLRIGQIATITLPHFNVSGLWVITEVEMQRLHNDIWTYRFRATSTSPLELTINSYLSIVRAGRASVLLPIGIFTHTQEFLSTQTWAIPGAGNVDVEIDVYGSGGGGGGYDSLKVVNGGAGGAGGKAATFLTLPAGTSLVVTVPAAAAGGVGDSVHTEATFTTSTTFTVPGTGNVRVKVIANGAGGGGAADAPGGFLGSLTGYPGGPGGQGTATRVFAAGTVLTITIGAGGAGGSGTSGNPGSGGGATSVSSGGVLAQGNGGSGGTAQFTGGGVNGTGASGTGSGDSVTPGGGSAGGAGGGNTNSPGSNGSNGTVVIQWSDANDGANGGLTKVEIAGAIVASATGGLGGVSGVDGGANGADSNGAVGDQTFSGLGHTGGAGGTVAVVNGSAGLLGSVIVRY